MLNFTRRKMMSVLAAVALGASAVTAAAEYPEKPVTLVVPYKAGGSTETMARVFSKALGEALGVNVVVKTRPGAGGAVGATEVAAMAPDGYTVLFAAVSSLLWPPMTQNVKYDVDSFTYVGQITEYQQAIIAKADAPFDTMDELIEYAKTNSLNFADQGGMSKIFVDFIGAQVGVKWQAIPTKGGGEMVPFLLGGKVDFAWSGGVHNRYGDEMKVLMSMNPGRLLASADIPSVSETFGVSMPSQAVLVVPKGTPADIVATLETAIEKATTDAEFVDMVTNKLKFPAKFVGSAQLANDIDDMIAGLKEVLSKVQ
ncbi:MAG: Bug family tripartite tricarboxylate transporter substrate binding protein [Sedimentitalea sp.]